MSYDPTDDDPPARKCPWCNGTGREYAEPNSSRWIPCPDCNGTGQEQEDNQPCVKKETEDEEFEIITKNERTRMNLNEYQKQAMTTCEEQCDNIIYMTLGLAGEAGEFANKVKKQIRDGALDEKAAMKELGDVLWYVAGCAKQLGYDLEDVARVNLLKLADRAERNAIGGNGDER